VQVPSNLREKRGEKSAIDNLDLGREWEGREEGAKEDTERSNEGSGMVRGGGFRQKTHETITLEDI